MQTYMVGGAVRDALLGRPVNDHDWVVVGGTPEAMIEQGFLPVGKDFPVFLHPRTREEHALARTERKTARGYRGFAVSADPGVTLEEDLARRDLTINAIAQDENGVLVDPFHGQRDLALKVLRHVTDSFREDPVRILRVARFAARFADFSLAPETLQLMREMVQDGEADHLVAERVWQELSRGLMEPTPSRMFDLLRQCGALERVLPELDRLWGVPQRAEYHPEVDTGVHMMMVLDMCARLEAPLTVRFACLTHDLGKGTTRACSRRWRTGCASPTNAASWPTWWPGSTATSTAAPSSARRRWCGCWNVATPFASRCDSTRRCWPASATPGAAAACRSGPTRSARGCWRRSTRHWKWRPMRSPKGPWRPAPRGRRSAS